MMPTHITNPMQYLPLATLIVAGLFSLLCLIRLTPAREIWRTSMD